MAADILTLSFIAERGRAVEGGICTALSKIQLDAPVTSVDIDSFLVTLAGFTEGLIGQTTLSNVATHNATPPVDSNLDKRGIIFFKDPLDSTTRRFTVHAWDTVAHPVDSNPTAGDRIVAVDVASIVTALNVLLGRVAPDLLIPMYGYYEQPK